MPWSMLYNLRLCQTKCFNKIYYYLLQFISKIYFYTPHSILNKTFRELSTIMAGVETFCDGKHFHGPINVWKMFVAHPWTCEMFSVDPHCMVVP